MWCLNTTLGYLVNFEMYQGSNPRMNEEYNKEYGKNIGPLFCMIDDFDEETKKLPFCFYFDNLFTSPRALIGLRQRGYEGTGTIRQNVIPKSCPLPTKDVLKKEKRGHMISSKIDGSGIIITKWVDNAVVSIASSWVGKLPVGQVSRYSRVEHKRIQLERPAAILQYNQHMGGTDRMDQNVNNYRIGARGKKWWYSIFTWVVYVAVQNAWHLHRKHGGKISQLEFRQSIANRYCRTLGESRPPQGYRRPKQDGEFISRYDNVGHYLVPVPENKRRRCAAHNCKSSVKSMCLKCDVGLCIACNHKYHFVMS